MIGIRVEIVPDDDRQARSDIPKDVLAALGPCDVLMNFAMMYVRASLWEKIKHEFAIKN